MIWIAVDAMGGDEAPGHIVAGALAAARHFDLGVTLVGPVSRLEDEIAKHPDADTERVRIVRADAVVEMSEPPAAALRRKPGASIRVAAELAAAGDAAALFSAGHTGATVMAAHGAFGMLPGVDRPALGRDHPDPAQSGVAARCRGERRVPAASSAAVCGDGQHVCAGGVRDRAAAHRAAVDRRRGIQGQ